MNNDLHNRRALVTGSIAGIGFAIARELAASGAAVVINGRTQGSVGRAISSLRSEVAKASVSGIAADGGCAEGCQALIAEAPDIDILVNNVGILGVNTLSSVRLSRHHAPRMYECGWGRVIFICRESLLNIHTLLAVSRGLADEMAGSAVTVNVVVPGPTRSEGVEVFLEQLAQHQGKTQAEIEAEFFRTARPTSLIPRFADPREVANLVVYLASPAASATTGVAFRMGGGVAAFKVGI